MTISVGSQLPEAKLLQMGANGPEAVDLSAKLKGRNVVIFGLPGAYTGTCTTSHVPSFMRRPRFPITTPNSTSWCTFFTPAGITMAPGGCTTEEEGLRKNTGGAAAGISFLADGDASFTKAVGMDFTVPAIGFHDRSKRYALQAVNGVVKVLHAEENAGQCDISGGEAMLAAI